MWGSWVALGSSSSNFPIYHLPIKMHLSFAKRPISKRSEWKHLAAQRGRLFIKIRNFLNTRQRMTLYLSSAVSRNTVDPWGGPRPLVLLTAREVLCGGLAQKKHVAARWGSMYISASCMDAHHRPTCCAALPGDRGQVRVNIEDPVRHLSLSGNQTDWYLVENW